MSVCLIARVGENRAEYKLGMFPVEDTDLDRMNFMKCSQCKKLIDKASTLLAYLAFKYKCKNCGATYSASIGAKGTLGFMAMGTATLVERHLGITLAIPLGLATIFLLTMIFYPPNSWEKQLTE
jgi:phage FluMu protein Com